MKDHNYIDEMGSRVPVSQMALKDIHEILAVGRIELVNNDGDDDTTEAGALERLRIELLIRSLGL